MTRTANDVIATLTQEAGQDKDTTAAALSEARPAAIPGLKAPRRLTVVVDAIDEATEPVRLAHELAYLASEGAAVIVGARTRPDVLYALRPSRIIDLEADEYWSPRAVEEFVRRMLTTQPESPYRDNPSAATLVAREVAHRAGGSFLFARLATEVLIRRPLVADPTSASHIALSEGVLEAVLRRLNALRGDRQVAEQLLAALAFATFDLTLNAWLEAARKLGVEQVGPEDVQKLLASPAGELVSVARGVEPTYRLYHAAVADAVAKLWSKRRDEAP